MIELVPWWSTDTRILRVPLLFQCPGPMKCNWSSDLLGLLLKDGTRFQSLCSFHSLWLWISLFWNISCKRYAVVSQKHLNTKTKRISFFARQLIEGGKLQMFMRKNTEEAMSMAMKTGNNWICITYGYWLHIPIHARPFNNGSISLGKSHLNKLLSTYIEL